MAEDVEEGKRKLKQKMGCIEESCEFEINKHMTDEKKFRNFTF